MYVVVFVSSLSSHFHVVLDGYSVARFSSRDEAEACAARLNAAEKARREARRNLWSEDAEVAAAAVVVVSVPVCDPNKPSGEQTVAVLAPRQGASRLLQIPDSDKAAMAAKGLALDTVDYDDAGNLIMSGRAKPNTTVQVYVNNQPVGAPTADAKGRWTLKLDQTIPPGLYTLRVDQVEDSGKVVSRLELPFARASAADIDLKTGSVVVQPGNSLWRLARATYGDGAQFTTIYQNNQDQIRDPNLIYPGQVFSLPKPKTAGN